MINDVLLVTSPDDVTEDGIRILCVGLSLDQEHKISESLLKFDTTRSKVIVYIWKAESSVQWMLDKKEKSDLIFFNAEAEISPMILGYIAAHKNSFYFGNLKDLYEANKRAIYNVEDISFLLEKVIVKL